MHPLIRLSLSARPGSELPVTADNGLVPHIRVQSAVFLLVSTLMLASACGTDVARPTAVVSGISDATSTAAVVPALSQTVPDVVGLSSQAAIRELQVFDFVIRQVFAASETVPSNEVISQSPEALTEVEQGEVVEITISSGATPVTVPSVVGLDADDAARFLQDRGFSSELEVRQGSTAQAGQVLRQDPAAGSEVTQGSTVVLFIAEGLRAIEVPEVMGMTLLKAAQVLAQAGLEVTDEIVELPSSDVERGLVIGTDPSPPVLVLSGSPIQIVVSLGVENVVDQTVTRGSESSGPLEIPPEDLDPRRAQAWNAATEVTGKAITTGRQPDALGTITKWNALSTRFETECNKLATTYTDIPGFSAEWIIELPYPMPASAANAANWTEGLNGNNQGVDDGCAVSWN